MICANCGNLITFGGPPCCEFKTPYDRESTYEPPALGFDYNKLLDTPPIDFSDVTYRATRMVNEAIEKLLNEWVSKGMPLDRAVPKWEFGDIENGTLPVRVWIDWRELPGDVTVTLPEMK